MSFKVVIPARYASTRLPGKPLLDIAGRPMIEWVIAASLQSRAEEVLVATDDVRIAERVGERAVMTQPSHQSGTDRIAEVARQRGWSDETIVVNVQGDEPQLPSALIDQVASLLKSHPDADIATLCTPICSLQEFLEPNVVKVVTAQNGLALYFSRAPIPFDRDGAPDGVASQSQFQGAHRHLGLYAYRVAALRKLSTLEPSELERIEKLEQLRALQAGMKIVVAVASEPPPAGVDTPEDLARVRAALTAL
ncbi:MAG: 3-deoxy-manno-octulosonate cytidylyltransferase [Gammaproteobacteria bacterium]|nr:3-deoxy-manno-octulosonate cytidylyltransferase [Gammaproteobacteria bacterium]